MSITLGGDRAGVSKQFCPQWSNSFRYRPNGRRECDWVDYNFYPLDLHKSKKSHNAPIFWCPWPILKSLLQKALKNS